MPDPNYKDESEDSRLIRLQFIKRDATVAGRVYKCLLKFVQWKWWSPVAAMGSCVSGMFDLVQVALQLRQNWNGKRPM